ncbi:hypothetical protein [Algibacter sp. R77976]|uniref:hypothetical protein n=1 Tax=Algibacter sp. R77976 TaxID=3093873 RepID=UPI0037C73A4A
MRIIYFKNVHFLVSTFLCVTLFSSNAFSQSDTLYFNLDGVKINKERFKNKIEKDFYEATMYTTDTLVEMKLKLLYCFGKLSGDVKTQLFKLLSSRHEVDTTKILSCFYKDTLKSKSEFPLKNEIYLISNVGDTLKKRSFSNIRSMYYTSKQWKKQNGEIKTLRNYKAYHRLNRGYIRWNHNDYKKSVELLMFYGVNNGGSDKIQGLKWHKDYGNVIKKLFNYKDENFSYVLIKPNGEFFIKYGFIATPFSDLFNNTDWEFHRNKFLKER